MAYSANMAYLGNMAYLANMAYSAKMVYMVYCLFGLFLLCEWYRLLARLVHSEILIGYSAYLDHSEVFLV